MSAEGFIGSVVSGVCGMSMYSTVIHLVFEVALVHVLFPNCTNDGRLVYRVCREGGYMVW